MTLLVSPNQAPSSLGETSADAMIAVSDVGGSVRGFVGEDVRSAQGLDRRAVFVSERHGEIANAVEWEKGTPWGEHGGQRSLRNWMKRGRYA
jgi:hypothetical protein